MGKPCRYVLLVVVCWCVQGRQAPSRANSRTPPPVVASPVGTSAAVATLPALKPVSPVEPEISGWALSAAANKVRTLHLAPNFSTVIRMGETVRSVAVGDPERFLAEHSEKEPELVFVKPTTTDPAQSDLAITTVKGHTVTLLLESDGEGARHAVDVMLTLDPPREGRSSFLIEDATPHPIRPASARPSRRVLHRGIAGGEAGAWQTVARLCALAGDVGPKRTRDGAARRRAG